MTRRGRGNVDLEGGPARWRPLQFGATTAGAVEVLSALESGDTVLAGATLYAGMLVEARP